MIRFLKRLTIFGLVAVSFLALVAAGASLVQPSYTVYVDGSVQMVDGSFRTVGDVLNAANVMVGTGDLVVPAWGNPITPEQGIQITRAKQVSVKTDEDEQLYYTHQPTLGTFLHETGLRIGRTDQVKADGQLVAFGALNSTALPQRLEIGRFHTITIHENEQTTTLVTDAQTVGEALLEANIQLYATDGVEPPLGSWLTPDLTITIKRSQPYTILVDGRTLETRSHYNNSLDILAETGIGLVGLDYVHPAPEEVLEVGATIEVVRVTEDFILSDTPIFYETEWQASDQLEIDTTGVVVAGRDGILRERTRIRYENGVEVSRTFDGEWIAEEPVTEILGYGTNIIVRTLDTPSGTIEYWRKVRMRVTSYTAATSGKAADDPWYGITASGVQAGYGVVAIDPKVVPFRSSVYVPGYGVGFAGDTGGGILGRWIDLGYDEDAFEWWRGYVDVYYLTPVPEPDRINYLIPTWLP